LIRAATKSDGISIERSLVMRATAADVLPYASDYAKFVTCGSLGLATSAPRHCGHKRLRRRDPEVTDLVARRRLKWTATEEAEQAEQRHRHTSHAVAYRVQSSPRELARARTLTQC
jgi:hypothetical protein